MKVRLLIMCLRFNAVLLALVTDASSFAAATCPPISKTENPPCDFSDRSIKSADFSNSDLSISDFSRANLEDVSFDGATLNSADFSHAKLKNVTFGATTMMDANFSRSQLQQVSFEGARMINTTFGFSQIDASKFINCSGRKASFYAARLSMTNFSGNSFQEGDFGSATIGSGVWENNRFDDIVLASAKITKTRLSGIDLRYADLRGSSWRDITLQDVDLREALVDNSQFTGVSCVRVAADLAEKLKIQLCGSGIDWHEREPGELLVVGDQPAIRRPNPVSPLVKAAVATRPLILVEAPRITKQCQKNFPIDKKQRSNGKKTLTDGKRHTRFYPCQSDQVFILKLNTDSWAKAQKAFLYLDVELETSEQAAAISRWELSAVDAELGENLVGRRLNRSLRLKLDSLTRATDAKLRLISTGIDFGIREIKIVFDAKNETANWQKL